MLAQNEPGYYRSRSSEGMFSPTSHENYPTPRQAPTPTAPTPDSYAQTVYKLRQEAEQKSEQEYQQAKSAIDAAFQAGLMTDSQYQDALNESFETTRAQYGVAAQSFTEGAYGQVNVGAVKGQLATLRGEEAEAIGKGERDVRFQRAEQRATAAEKKAAGYQDLYRTREVNMPDIPTDFTQAQHQTALTGQAPKPHSYEDTAYMNTPGAAKFRNVGMDPNKMHGYSYSYDKGWYRGPKRVVSRTKPKLYNRGRPSTMSTLDMARDRAKVESMFKSAFG